jgi:hypothetical protein
MKVKLFALTTICLLLISGCTKQSFNKSKEDRMTFLALSKPPATGETRGGGGGTDKDVKHFIAVKHQFVVETPEAELVKALEATLKFCQTIKCEVLNSNIVGQTSNSAPGGSLSLRIIPNDIDKFFDHLKRSATILEHRTESEDKTTEVIDVEAKLKNMTELRDRLRALLAKAPASVKALVELERELANVQSDIDSLTTTRKVLANETEKIAVLIDFQPQQSITRTGAFAPIANAWHDSGKVLSESFGTLMTFIFALIPWLIILLPLLWLIVRMIRRKSRKQKVAPE